MGGWPGGWPGGWLEKVELRLSQPVGLSWAELGNIYWLLYVNVEYKVSSTSDNEICVNTSHKSLVHTFNIQFLYISLTKYSVYSVNYSQN